MAVEQRKPGSGNVFTDHPRSLGMSWASHGAGAVKIGAELIGAGAACIVHAIVPAWFTETAGRTVLRLHDVMVKRKAGAKNPNEWPDYEI
ncbi:MAG TPA: DUF6356 family protein [Sphingomicrobium sp.]|jgi:hypothetical protein|nr:DUF6356 family protein [Sphingomicrobium sp.]